MKEFEVFSKIAAQYKVREVVARIKAEGFRELNRMKDDIFVKEFDTAIKERADSRIKLDLLRKQSKEVREALKHELRLKFRRQKASQKAKADRQALECKRDRFSARIQRLKGLNQKIAEMLRLKHQEQLSRLQTINNNSVSCGEELTQAEKDHQRLWAALLKRIASLDTAKDGDKENFDNQTSSQSSQMRRKVREGREKRPTFWQVRHALCQEFKLQQQAAYREKLLKIKAKIEMHNLAKETNAKMMNDELLEMLKRQKARFDQMKRQFEKMGKSPKIEALRKQIPGLVVHNSGDQGLFQVSRGPTQIKFGVPTDTIYEDPTVTPHTKDESRGSAQIKFVVPNDTIFESTTVTPHTKDESRGSTQIEFAAPSDTIFEDSTATPHTKNESLGPTHMSPLSTPGTGPVDDNTFGDGDFGVDFGNSSFQIDFSMDQNGDNTGNKNATGNDADFNFDFDF